jgi:hypothetical protein
VNGGPSGAGKIFARIEAFPSGVERIFWVPSYRKCQPIAIRRRIRNRAPKNPG